MTIAPHNAEASHKPTVAALCSTSFNASSLTTTAPWYDFRFDTGCRVNAGTEHVRVISSSGDDTTSKAMVGINTTCGYAPGQRGYSADGGTTWTVTTQDIAFKEGGWPA